MPSKLINRERWPIGFRRSVDVAGRVPARTRRLQAAPPVSEEELARAVHEYRKVREEHRLAGPAGSARRRLETRLRRIRRRFERLLAEAPLGTRERRSWRNSLRHAAPTPDVHADVRPVLFRGRSKAGSELLLLPVLDGTVEAFVGGAAVGVLDRADELEQTAPEFVFNLDGTVFRESFAVPESTLEELREAVAGGGAPRPENLRELIEDGLIDRTLGLTARGRRALALDRHPTRREEHAPTPTITLRGPVARSARAELADTLSRLARAAPRPVLRIRGVVTRDEDPALEHPVITKATIDLGSHAVHAHASAATEHEAIDLLAGRLRRKLRALADRESADRRAGAVAEIGEWRHRSTPSPRLPHYPRPPGERRIVRRRTYSAAPITPEEAADELLRLGHDFHLFVDATTGEDALVHIRPDGALALRRHDGSGAYVEPFVLDTDPVLTLRLDDAIERLRAADERFVFFMDLASGRGAVLYHRDDGRYGLVTAAS